MRLTVETLKPGLVSVYSQDLLTVRAVIARESARKWKLSSDKWQTAAWRCRTVIDSYSSQALALAQAGAWLQSLYLSTRPTAPTVCKSCGYDGQLTPSGECHQCADPDAKR